MDGKVGDKEKELIQLHADRQRIERKVADQATTIQGLQVRYACILHIFTLVLCVLCMLYTHQVHAFCHLYQSVNVCLTHAHAWHMFVWESEADVLQVLVKHIHYVCLCL